MKKETWKALQRSVELEEKLRRFNELADKALGIVYSNVILIDGINERFVENWVPLYAEEWFDVNIQPYQAVETLFINVSRADINKAELKKALLPSKLAMEEYSEQLEKKLNEAREIVNKDYDKEMALNAGVYRFIVEEPAVKELFFKWLEPED